MVYLEQISNEHIKLLRILAYLAVSAAEKLMGKS
jgi:hypothetical protein